MLEPGETGRAPIYPDVHCCILEQLHSSSYQTQSRATIYVLSRVHFKPVASRQNQAFKHLPPKLRRSDNASLHQQHG
jgi:hypothetical protein